MSTQTNPFFNFDVTGIMADFDPTRVADRFTKLTGNFKLPVLDMESLMTTQRKNIEALSAANSAVVEGVQDVSTRQAEIFQAALDDASKVFVDFNPANPMEAAGQQADHYRNALEHALGNMTELAEMVAKTGREATTVMNERISASLKEMNLSPASENEASADPIMQSQEESVVEVIDVVAPEVTTFQEPAPRQEPAPKSARQEKVAAKPTADVTGAAPGVDPVVAPVSEGRKKTRAATKKTAK